jgi:5-methyltetrahydrofolate--homocysteine methyltransferase
MKWKPDWQNARENLTKWWAGRGLALWLTAPRDHPVEAVDEPAAPADLVERWTQPAYRCSAAEYRMSRTCYAAEAFPYFDTQIGPGSLGTFLGAEPHFAETTVWYEPCITDAEAFGPVRFEASGNRWLEAHLAVMDEGLRRAAGRYLVGIPDLIENLDTLAALRDTEQVLVDLVERPGWVERRLWEINEAFFAAFELMYERVRGADGGSVFSAFCIWGAGRTAKVQCDISAMLSPAMFRRFVAPPLAAQCDWLDCSLYHLDGEDALQHLEALLAIPSLDAIEFTPRGGFSNDAASPPGGSPHWYDLYRRIKAGGKAVQAIGVREDEVIPLIEAVGPEGLFICARAADQGAAEALAQRVEQYR